MTTADEESRQDPARAVDDVWAIGEIVNDRKGLREEFCGLGVLQGRYLLPLVVQDLPESLLVPLGVEGGPHPRSPPSA